MRCRPSRRTTIMRRSSCSTRLAEPGRKGGRKPYGTPEEGMGASEPRPPPRPPGPPRLPRPPPSRPPERPPEPLPDDIAKLQDECISQCRSSTIHPVGSLPARRYVLHWALALGTFARVLLSFMAATRPSTRAPRGAARKENFIGLAVD